MNVRKNRVAVISQNAVVTDFFRLEAQACGCAVWVMSEPPPTLRAFERVVLDVTAGACIADHAGCLVAVVMTDETKPLPIACDENWEWPVSVKTVRAFFEGDAAETPCQQEIGDHVIHLLSRESRELLYRNRKITLTPYEWRILLALSEAKGETVSRERLRWILGDETGNMADVYIHHLRKKLEGESGIRLIYTVRAQGYRLDAFLTDLGQNS